MADPERKISIFSAPSEIDAVIKARLATFCKKGGKNPATRWPEDELELRNAVILDYIAAQGLSREQTAQQIAARWGITPGTGRNYVTRAVQDFAKKYTQSDEAEANRKLYIERLESVLQTALERGSLDSSLRALEIYGKAMGFFLERKDVSLSGDTTFTFDFA